MTQYEPVNNAMRHFEVRVRQKASCSNDKVGVNLMNEVFNKESGKRIITCCNTEEERHGFHLITMGLIKFHRNLKAHHEGKLMRQDALKIVGYIDYLLGILDNASRERNQMDQFF